MERICIRPFFTSVRWATSVGEGRCALSPAGPRQRGGVPQRAPRNSLSLWSNIQIQYLIFIPCLIFLFLKNFRLGMYRPNKEKVSTSKPSSCNPIQTQCPEASRGTVPALQQVLAPGSWEPLIPTGSSLASLCLLLGLPGTLRILEAHIVQFCHLIMEIISHYSSFCSSVAEVTRKLVSVFQWTKGKKREINSLPFWLFTVTFARSSYSLTLWFMTSAWCWEMKNF